MAEEEAVSLVQPLVQNLQPEDIQSEEFSCLCEESKKLQVVHTHTHLKTSGRASMKAASTEKSSSPNPPPGRVVLVEAVDASSAEVAAARCVRARESETSCISTSRGVVVAPSGEAAWKKRRAVEGM